MPTHTFPGPPPAEALKYFKEKDLRIGFDHRDVWGREHAHAFTVAKVAELDILDDIKGALNDALAEGRTFRDFANNLKPELAKKGWWGLADRIDPKDGQLKEVQLGSPRRLRTIYQTNLRTARAAGQWERVQRRKQTHPYLLYQLGPSEHHREEHVKWAGLILPVDHPFWQTHYPQNGWGCKCRVRAVSKHEYERLVGTGKYLTEAPKIEYREWINRRTGEVLQVPKGIDPGWDHNPGQNRTRVVRERLTQQVNTEDQQFARAAVDNIMQSPVLDGWIATPEGELPVGILSRDIQTALGAHSQVVRLSEQTLDKQSRHHSELTADHYRVLPDLIHNGVVIRQGDNKLVMFRKEAGKWQKAVVKITGNGERVYLLSYHETDYREVKRMTAKGPVIRGKER